MICFCEFCHLFRTKDVVATSILSKRWRTLWVLVPQLQYNDINHNGGDYKSFSQFVYRSILSNKAPVLEILYLNLGPDCPVIDIGLWINVALSRLVRKLEIDIRDSKEGSVTLPSSLYTSHTLETLILGNFIILNVSSSVCLLSLKVLHLKRVDYVDNTSLPSLLSGCPHLQELFVERDMRDNTTDTAVVVPSLQRLSMIDNYSATFDRYMIHVPSLKQLRITDEADYNFRLIENMPELVGAFVHITQGVSQKFLRALTSVQNLSLCLYLSEFIHPSGMIFNQLVHPKLYTIIQGWWDLLTCMLQDSPKLQSLEIIDIHGYGYNGKESPVGWKPPSSVPACLLFSLEAFEWFGYKGRRGDREIATYVLKNAYCLKMATFSPESTNVGEKYQLLKELASVPRASTSSQLLFDYNKKCKPSLLFLCTSKLKSVEVEWFWYLKRTMMIISVFYIMSVTHIASDLAPQDQIQIHEVHKIKKHKTSLKHYSCCTLSYMFDAVTQNINVSICS